MISPVFTKDFDQNDEKHFISMNVNVKDQSGPNEKRYFFQNQKLLVNSRNVLLLNPIINTLKQKVPNILGQDIFLDVNERLYFIGNDPTKMEDENLGYRLNEYEKGASKQISFCFNNSTKRENNEELQPPLPPNHIQLAQKSTPAQSKAAKTSEKELMLNPSQSIATQVFPKSGPTRNLQELSRKQMIQNQARNNALPQSEEIQAKVRERIMSSQTGSNGVGISNVGGNVNQDEVGAINNISDSLGIKPISREKRVKQRKIGYVLEKVNMWRKLYTEGYPDQNGTMIKMNLDLAATFVGLSRKTLDDYYQQIKKAQVLNFEFDQHLEEKMGYLRSFVKERSGETRKYRGSTSINIKMEDQDEEELEDEEPQGTAINAARVTPTANFANIAPTLNEKATGKEIIGGQITTSQSMMIESCGENQPSITLRDQTRKLSQNTTSGSETQKIKTNSEMDIEVRQIISDHKHQQFQPNLLPPQHIIGSLPSHPMENDKQQIMMPLTSQKHENVRMVENISPPEMNSNPNNLNSQMMMFPPGMINMQRSYSNLSFVQQLGVPDNNLTSVLNNNHNNNIINNANINNNTTNTTNLNINASNINQIIHHNFIGSNIAPNNDQIYRPYNPNHYQYQYNNFQHPQMIVNNLFQPGFYMDPVINKQQEFQNNVQNFINFREENYNLYEGAHYLEPFQNGLAVDQKNQNHIESEQENSENNYNIQLE